MRRRRIDGAPADRLVVVAILLALAVALGLSVAAWTTSLGLYADGALFSFCIGIDESWTRVWHIMPARIAVYLLEIRPAELAREAGLPAIAAMRLYQALFLGVPFIGLVSCLAVLPRPLRWQLLFPAVSILALSVSALGYPTETLLTLAGFWPALFGHRHASGNWGAALLTVFWTSVFLFSHPGMILALPLLPLAAALRLRESAEPPARRVLAVLGAVEAALLVLWAWRFGIERQDPGIIQSSQRMWSVSGLEDVVRLQPAILVVCLSIALFAALGWRRSGAGRWSAAAIAPAIAAGFALSYRETVTPESHYYIRTALIALLPVLGAVTLAHRRGAPQGVAALALVIALTVTQTTHNLHFLGAWLDYRDSVAAEIGSAPPRIVPLSRVLADRAEPAAPSIAWSWGQPYLSVTLPGLPSYRAIVADPAPTSYSPFHCSEMDDIAARADWLPPETRTLLTDYVCARRPG
jgi:hypothetical protein